MAAGKTKRTPKTSKGIHGGGGKVRLDEVTKVLLGKGAYARIDLKPAHPKS